MFLKNLEIFGFKSFADRIHIDFAEGITALLGPNGCGKSNVVDAIKWVLAENKSKSLRAAKMEDVIFNGTERRPPLNIAEVTLTIMNENSLLPLEVPEIAIKRRIYRSGENEYYINNSQVGPSEIKKLFMDTGIGKAAYSVMEQGKIDQILSSKPEDRRYLFEEAAGISRSKAECAEAERELERTRINLQQTEISLAEIKRSYDTLKTQSEKTIRYRKIKEEIFNNELDIQLLKLKGFIQDKSRSERDLEATEEKRNAVRAEIEEINNTLSENMDKVKAMQEEVYEKQAGLIGIQKEKNGKLDLAKQFNERSGEIKEKIAQLEAHEKAVQTRIDDLNDEIDERSAGLHEKDGQLSGISKNIKSFEQNIAQAASLITENDKAAAECEKKIAELEKIHSTLRGELGAITEDIVTQLDSKLKEAGISSAAVNKAKDDLRDIIEKLKIFLSGRKNIFADIASSNTVAAHSTQTVAAERQAGQGFAEKNNLAAKEAEEAFAEAEKMLLQLEGAVNGYITATPQFLEEFLSPEGIITQKRKIDEKIRNNEEDSDKNKKRIASLESENSGLAKKIDEYKETLQKLRINEAQMQAEITAAKQQIELLRKNLVSEQNTLRSNEEELYTEQKRDKEVNEQILSIEQELAEIENRGKRLAEELKELDKKIIEGNSNVSGKQEKLKKKQEEQNKFQERYEHLSVSLSSLDTEIRNIKQNFSDTHSRDLMEFEERMYTLTAPAAVLREKLNEAKEVLKELGQVNLMAPEEFGEVKERYERQQTHYDDTKTSLENLERVSEEIKVKSTEMFLDTYNKIKKNFHNMFRRLFNGGRAELRLEDPQNVLTSGIEIFAQPPGKKLESIVLLSGGEKTMTAVALLFATYQVRPSPFCLLDEIDAALDDNNVSSFITSLRAFANVSQYIIITHNKKTVLGANTMLGVTMEESGVSKVIALRLDEDIKSAQKEEEFDANFVEEDVAPEEGVYIPPRPPKRIYNADGTITDPVKKNREKAPSSARTADKNAEAVPEKEKNLGASAETDAEENVSLKNIGEDGSND
ncbi:AAA family ATPase [Treponema parvum]|uniref:Chromosome partition protein Smc n=1 Tax=Treponema parvum TaxID=138851 RepID=A0A975IC53_9SPIR|nr:AAA family ATPase [Treponema parvum]QTQ11397.1 AAA family ATPase [Treponema parvum]